MTRKERTRLVQTLVAAIIACALAGGALAILIGVKASERRALASYTAGPSCRRVDRPPSFVSEAALKRIDIGQASFRFLRGDADCTVLRPGRMDQDAEAPVCRLDHPGYVEASTPAGVERFVIPFGQASLVVEASKTRCAVQPSP
jgi:hypothetical protein